MKRKIAYIFTTAVISLAAFSIGKFTAETPDPEPTETGLINVNDIKGWEYWDDGKIAGIELQADNWTYEITKVPYTVDTTVTKTE